MSPPTSCSGSQHQPNISQVRPVSSEDKSMSLPQPEFSLAVWNSLQLQLFLFSGKRSSSSRQICENLGSDVKNSQALGPLPSSQGCSVLLEAAQPGAILTALVLQLLAVGTRPSQSLPCFVCLWLQQEGILQLSAGAELFVLLLHMDQGVMLQRCNFLPCMDQQPCAPAAPFHEEVRAFIDSLFSWKLRIEPK